MTNFDDLQALWNQQPDPNSPPEVEAILTKAERIHRQMRATHRWTLLILSVTVLVLVGYFSRYGTTKNQLALMGSLLMLLSLVLRIGIEYVSYRRFGRIKLTTNLRTCLTQTRSFHQVRQRIQWVITPLSLSSYVVGFILLLPYIKKGVSEGFYVYILASGTLSLGVIGIIIYQQIRREMRLLAQLETGYASLLSR